MRAPEDSTKFDDGGPVVCRKCGAEPAAEEDADRIRALAARDAVKYDTHWTIITDYREI